LGSRLWAAGFGQQASAEKRSKPVIVSRGNQMRLDKFTLKGQEAIETAVALAETRGHNS
jgi:hypothetical protein